MLIPSTLDRPAYTDQHAGHFGSNAMAIAANVAPSRAPRDGTFPDGFASGGGLEQQSSTT